MAGSVAVVFIIDFFFTTGVAFGASWWFTSRYLARRTSEHLGKDDVALFNEMHSILIALEATDDMIGSSFAMPEKIRKRIKGALAMYNNTKQFPY